MTVKFLRPRTEDGPVRHVVAADPMLEAIVEETAAAAASPMALVTLLTPDAQWVVAGRGWDVARSSREAAFCAWTVHSAGVMWVEDARGDNRFWDNPFVVGEPYVRFYAGAPIAVPSGSLMGTLCALDVQPRGYDPDLAAKLEVLAARAAARLPPIGWRPR